MKKAATLRARPQLGSMRNYQAKWANALLASAMRWTFSRLADGGAFAVVGGDQLVGQLLGMARPFFSRIGHQHPADRQRLLPRAVDLHRHLVGGAADALRADFDRRLHVLDAPGEDLDRLLVGQPSP